MRRKGLYSKLCNVALSRDEVEEGQALEWEGESSKEDTPAFEEPGQ